MNRRSFRQAMLAGIGAAALAPRAFAQARSTVLSANNIVLVHGLFADGSSWSDVIPTFQMYGLNVIALQNPLTTVNEVTCPPAGSLDLM